MAKYFLFSFFICSLILSQENIFETEKLRYKSMIEADTVTLQDLLHDNLIYNHSNGSSETKSNFINSLSSGKLIYKYIETEERKLIDLGKTAIISGIVNMTVVFEGSELKLKNRFSAVYIHDKKWKLVLWQSTRINRE